MERQKNEKKEPPIPYEDLLKGAVPCPEAEELLHQAPEDMRRVIVVLDDDPTGIQTVHDVCVYTRWDRKTITDAFREDHRMFCSTGPLPGTFVRQPERPAGTIS